MAQLLTPRTPVRDSDVKRQLVQELKIQQDDTDSYLYRLSNGPSFRESFYLGLVQTYDELISFLNAQPRSMLNDHGVLDDIYQEPLVMDQVSVEQGMVDEFRRKNPYQLLLPFEINKQYYQPIYPASLGQILRYSPDFLKAKAKMQLIADSIQLVQYFHSKGMYFGAGLNVDRAFVDLKTNSLRFYFPERCSRERCPRNLNFTGLWLGNKLNNFQYIQILNILAGRRLSVFHTQFYPWVYDFNRDSPRDMKVSQYKINKGTEQCKFMFNNQNQTVSQQLKQTLSQYINLQATAFDVKTSEPHYVSSPGITDLTLFCYMARRAPLSKLKKYVRPRFVAKQYSDNIQGIYSWTPEECCIEFYQDSRVLTTDLDPNLFGTDPEYQHIFNTENVLTDIKLFKGMTAQQFVEWHYQYLNERAGDVNYWIDMTFGPIQSGVNAYLYQNKPINQCIQPLGMLNETFKMFEQYHPVRISEHESDSATKQDYKFQSIVSKEGHFLQWDTLQHKKIQDVVSRDQMQIIKAQSQFCIRKSFLPQFTQLMFERQFYYALDRIYLCQVIYQIQNGQWCIADDCFLECLDEQLVDGIQNGCRAIQPMQINNKHRQNDILQLIVQILQKCYQNTPLSISETSQMQFLNNNMETSLLKQQIHDFYNYNQQRYNAKFLNQLLQYQKLHKNKHCQRALDKYILTALLCLSDDDIEKVNHSIDIIGIMHRIFENRNTYEQIINDISVDRAFDELVEEDTEGQDRIVPYEQHNHKSCSCPLCGQQTHGSSQQLLIPQKVKKAYQTFLLRQKYVNSVVYDNYLSFEIVKDLYLKCTKSIQLYIILNKSKMNTNVAIANFFPIGIRLICEKMHNEEDEKQVLTKEFGDIVEDLVFFLLQLNDMQMTGSVLEFVLETLCQVSDKYLQYFYRGSRLAALGYQKLGAGDTLGDVNLQVDKTEKISFMLRESILRQIVVVMQQSQANIIFEQVLMPAFMQRYNILIDYLQLTAFNSWDEEAHGALIKDIRCISQPLLQIIQVMCAFVAQTSHDIARMLLDQPRPINPQFVDKELLLSHVMRYELQHLAPEKRMTGKILHTVYPLISLIMLPGLSKQYVYELLILVLGQVSEVLATESPAIFQNVAACCLLSCPAQVISQIQQVLRVNILPLHEALGELVTNSLNCRDNVEGAQLEKQAHNVKNNTHLLWNGQYIQHVLNNIVRPCDNLKWHNVLNQQEGLSCNPEQECNTSASNYTPMQERVDWLSNKINYDHIVRQLNVKLAKQLKLTQEQESFAKDYGKPGSMFYMFKGFLDEIGAAAEDIQRLVNLEDLLKLINGSSPIQTPRIPLPSEPVFSVIEPSNGYHLGIDWGFYSPGPVYSYVKQGTPDQYDVAPQLYELFDIMNISGQALNHPAQLTKIDSCHYIVVSDKKMQVINSNLIGHQRKAPQILNANYEFNNHVIAACPGKTSQIIFATDLGQIKIFDINRNEVITTVIEQSSTQLFQNYIGGLKIDALAQTYEQLFGSKQPLSTSEQTYSQLIYADNMIIAATPTDIEIYDTRMKIAQVRSVNQGKLAGKLSSLDQTGRQHRPGILQLKYNHNHIFVAGSHHLDEVDLRSLKTSNIYNYDGQYVNNVIFNQIGCNFVLDTSIQNIMHHNLSSTPFTSQLSQKVRVTHMPRDCRCSCINNTQNLLSVFSYNQQNQLFRSDIKLRNLYNQHFDGDVTYEFECRSVYEVKPNGAMSIYGLQDTIIQSGKLQDVRQCQYDDVLEVYFLLFASGQIGIVK